MNKTEIKQAMDALVEASVFIGIQHKTFLKVSAAIALCEASLARADERDLHKLLVGKLVSMDVSTGENDSGNRIFGRVCEVMLQSCGAQEDTVLAIEESRNFAAIDTEAAP